MMDLQLVFFFPLHIVDLIERTCRFFFKKKANLFPSAFKPTYPYSELDLIIILSFSFCCSIIKLI